MPLVISVVQKKNKLHLEKPLYVLHVSMVPKKNKLYLEKHLCELGDLCGLKKEQTLLRKTPL